MSPKIILSCISLFMNVKNIFYPQQQQQNGTPQKSTKNSSKCSNIKHVCVIYIFIINISSPITFHHPIYRRDFQQGMNGVVGQSVRYGLVGM